ncbi:hypothetical protein [Sorangium sp. So ce233]|uniref:hypothetical protein n=1 Tax=Sorangium sp. So ce233 TaxID=3133290 RepID=UPI003F6463E7
MRSSVQPVALGAASPLTRGLSAGWQRLLSAVDAGDDGSLPDAFSSVTGDLERLGVPAELARGVRAGLARGAWDDAVDAFGRCRDRDVGFYLGPMRAIEGAPLSTGLLLLERHPAASEVAALVERAAVEIGDRVFGFPCDFHGRHVEYYDVVLAAGPFAAARARYIALFTPFYLGGFSDLPRQQLLRRSVLFHNFARARFAHMTRPAAERHLRLGGALPRFLGAAEPEIDRAIALWLSLHELIHGSGPLPLFQTAVDKLGLGMTYAGIEEARVDMTVWLLLERCSDLWGELGGITQDIILAERVLRSARRGLRGHPDGGAVRSDSDSEAGAIWLSLLLRRAGATPTEAGLLDVDPSRVRSAIRAFLDDVYEREGDAASAPSRGEEILTTFADRVRAELFGGASAGPAYPPAAARFLDALEAPLSLRLTFPRGLAVA